MIFSCKVTDCVLDSSGKALGYHLSFDNQITMDFGKFRDLGLHTDASYEEQSITEHEDRFWQEISERGDDISKAPLYAIDNEIALFAKGQRNCWNLSQFNSSDSLIHQVGIFSPITVFIVIIILI